MDITLCCSEIHGTLTALALTRNHEKLISLSNNILSMKCANTLLFFIYSDLLHNAIRPSLT